MYCSFTVQLVYNSVKSFQWTGQDRTAFGYDRVYILRLILLFQISVQQQTVRRRFKYLVVPS